ncbi:MAG: hypothetical protein HOP30_14020 [Cyclobacteriaceae bacterium]|nr:hypothetical protein [Cyclobacteriaceae bacterium]
MKKISVLLSMVVFTLALGAAFASSSSKMLMTEVWRKPTTGGVCSPTTCLLVAPNPCSVSGFTYFNNSTCIGTSIDPRKN